MSIKKLDSIPDDNLIDLIREGNELAFSQLFERHWDKLLDVAIKVLKDEVVAKDVVQEVFLDLWNRRGEVSIENIGGYLRNATKFKVIDQIRKKKISLVELDFVDRSKTNNHTEETIDFIELNERLEKSISELPDQCQVVFKMSRMDHLSNKTIAEKLGISVRTVENHIAHALKTLRVKIGQVAASAILLAFLDVI